MSRDDAFSYDRDGNRLTKAEGGTTATYTYDRADQLVDQTVSGTTTSLAYNAWGDMTTSVDLAGDATTHAYDAGGRLTSLTPPGASASTFTYDALGRAAVRATGGASLAYGYLGSGPTSYAVNPSSGDATYALLDASGSRLGQLTGSTVNWTMFDLHGNLVANTAAAATNIVSALRYDPYGQLLDSYTAGSGATSTPWRYQGRLDLSPDADDPLYDFGARRYRPTIGTFTQLDTYAGTAQDPLSMNRFLYAHANPTTLIDPNGHCVGFNCFASIDGEVTIPKQGKQAQPTKAAAQEQATRANARATADFSKPPNGSPSLPRVPALVDLVASAANGYLDAGRAIAESGSAAGRSLALTGSSAAAFELGRLANDQLRRDIGRLFRNPAVQMAARSLAIAAGMLTVYDQFTEAGNDPVSATVESATTIGLSVGAGFLIGGICASGVGTVACLGVGAGLAVTAAVVGEPAGEVASSIVGGVGAGISATASHVGGAVEEAAGWIGGVIDSWFGRPDP